MKWIDVKQELPPEYRNVLVAFGEHWNQVVCFWTGEEWYETSAHDNNSKIAEPYPRWWMDIAEVPHRMGAEMAAPPERKEPL